MSNSSIMRVSNKAKETIEKLSKKSGEPMLSVVDKAVENYRRRVFLEETNRAYARLRANAEESKKFDDEIASMDATLRDGLDSGEIRDKKNTRSEKTKGRKGK